MTIEGEKTIENRVDIIDKYNSLIEKASGKLFTGLGYNKEGELFYNKAYFNKGQGITKEYIDSQIKEADNKIRDITEINKQVENETILNQTQKKLIKDRIEKIILTTSFHKNAIYIEAEKAGYKLSNKDRILYRNEIVRIENLLYGKPITELEGRKEEVIKKFHQIYEENKQELSTEEQEIRQKSILEKFSSKNAIETKKSSEKEKNIYIDEKHIFDLVSLILEIEGFQKEDIIRIQLIKDKEREEKNGIYYIPEEWKSKEVYDFFNEKGIGQKFKIIKKNLGSNSINITKENGEFKKNEINLSPAVNGKYNITEKILPIIYDHEVSTHINTGMGNFRNIYIKDPERSDLEEGIALFNQKMTENKDIKELYETSIGDVGMFLGEHFDEYQLKKLLEIYFKLTKVKDATEIIIGDRVRRIKMGVPIGEKGARRKDVTYGNGKEIIKELEELTKTPEGIETLNKYAKVIYSTKLGYDGIKNVDTILEGIKELDELDPNFPIFAGKIIYWKLFKGKLDKERMLENDLRRVIKTNKKITEKQKRLLVRILQLIRENKEENITNDKEVGTENTEEVS